MTISPSSPRVSSSPRDPREDEGWENPDSVTAVSCGEAQSPSTSPLTPGHAQAQSSDFGAGRGSALYPCAHSQGYPNAICHSALTGPREITLSAVPPQAVR